MDSEAPVIWRVFFCLHYSVSFAGTKSPGIKVFKESFLVYIGNVRIKLLFGIKTELPVLSKLIPQYRQGFGGLVSRMSGKPDYTV